MRSRATLLIPQVGPSVWLIPRFQCRLDEEQFREPQECPHCASGFCAPNTHATSAQSFGAAPPTSRTAPRRMATAASRIGIRHRRSSAYTHALLLSNFRLWPVSYLSDSVNLDTVARNPSLSLHVPAQVPRRQCRQSKNCLGKALRAIRRAVSGRYCGPLFHSALGRTDPQRLAQCKGCSSPN